MFVRVAASVRLESEAVVVKLSDGKSINSRRQPLFIVRKNSRKKGKDSNYLARGLRDIWSYICEHNDLCDEGREFAETGFTGLIIWR